MNSRAQSVRNQAAGCVSSACNTLPAQLRPSASPSRHDRPSSASPPHPPVMQLQPLRPSGLRASGLCPFAAMHGVIHSGWPGHKCWCQPADLQEPMFLGLYRGCLLLNSDDAEHLLQGVELQLHVLLPNHAGDGVVELQGQHCLKAWPLVARHGCTALHVNTAHTHLAETGTENAVCVLHSSGGTHEEPFAQKGLQGSCDQPGAPNPQRTCSDAGHTFTSSL